MNTLTTTIGLVLPLLLGACGAQLVSFPTDGGSDDGAGDGGVEDAAKSGADAAQRDAGSRDGEAGDADATIEDASGDGPARPDAADASQTNSDAANGDGSSSDAGNTDGANSDGATVDDAASSDAADADATSSDAADAGDASLTVDAAISPEVVATNPADGSATVSVTEILTATFNEPMNSTTINGTTFTLRVGGDASVDAAVDSSIAGTVTYGYGGTTASFAPAATLAIDTVYVATITTGAEDLAGHALATDYVWDFTTSVCGQATVVLGSTNDFALLAYSTITNTDITAVTGDLGVWPGTSVTGMGPGTTGTLVGNEEIDNPTAATAMGDLTTAYNDAAGRTLCAVSVAGNIGGQTLTPGLYKSTSSLAISSGNLTLDANGDPDAVFIFQMASTLTVTDGLQVILSGGAKASNIFWQVGSSATLDGTSSFQGTVMAADSISLLDGATLNGRALAMTGGVTMIGNVIVLPTP